MTDEELKIEKTAVQWVKSNNKRLKSLICDPARYPAEKQPVTIFMAGTPGAGKTEFSISLLGEFPNPIVRIDADEIREMMKEIGYEGSNAHCYQRASGNAVNNLYGHAIKHKQSVLIDGTFAYVYWRENVQRSIDNGRLVEIYYLYQDPSVAWAYCKKRENKQGRVVPLEVFISDYFACIKNVAAAKAAFGKQITLYFAKNDYQKRLEYIKIDVGSIEELLPNVYNAMELEKLLNSVEQNLQN